MSALIKPVFRSQSFFYLVSQFFQVMGYYGMRGAIVVYLIDGDFGLDQTLVLQLYGALTLMVYASRIIGGVAGDLLLKSKWATAVGGFLQAIGVLLLCLPFIPSIMIGVVLIVIGNGLYTPNCLAGIGRIYHHHSKGLDSIYTLFLLITNLGAALAAVLGAMEFGAISIFVLCAVFFIFAGVLTLLSKTTEVQELDVQKGIGIGRKVMLVISSVFIFGGFWLGYDFMFQVQDYLIYTKYIFEDLTITTDRFSLNQGVGVFFLVIFAILWLFVSMRRWIKIVLGGLFCFLAYSALAYAITADQEMIPTLVLIVVVFLGIAEALVVPTLYALVSRWTNPKYLATTMALCSLPVLIATPIIRSFHDFYEYSFPIVVSLMVAVLLGVTAKVVYGIITRHDNKAEI